MKQHPLLSNTPNPDEADTLISKMGSVQHPESVLTWREHEFSRLGFSGSLSTFLARTHIDLHEMEHRFLEKGCEHTMAVDILLGTNFLGEDPTWNWKGYEEDSDGEK